MKKSKNQLTRNCQEWIIDSYHANCNKLCVWKKKLFNCCDHMLVNVYCSMNRYVCEGFWDAHGKRKISLGTQCSSYLVQKEGFNEIGVLCMSARQNVFSHPRGINRQREISPQGPLEWVLCVDCTHQPFSGFKQGNFFFTKSRKIWRWSMLWNSGNYADGVY